LPDGTFRTYTTQGKKIADGTLNGYVTAPGGGGVDSVLITVERLSDSITQGELNDTIYYGMTRADGKYSINNIYYYEEDTFRITPFKGDHGFKPAEIITPLSIATHIVNENNFTDTSSFTISGKISTNEGMCFAKDVEIWVNGIYSGVNTNDSGGYTLTVPRIDNYTFKPKMEGHCFSPDSIVTLIVDDKSDVNFEDTTLFTLSGFIKGSCDYFIGQAEVRIFSKNELGCYDSTIYTDDSIGYYSITLPAMEYNVEVTGFTTVDEYIVTNEEVLQYFTTEAVNLSLNDEEKDFILRKPPMLNVTGFENIECGDYTGIPIVHQNYEYNIEFEVNEHIGDATCPADTGFVIVFNGLVNGPMQTDTIPLVDGIAEYQLIPGDPNIIPPHTKLLEAQAHVIGEIDDYNQQVLVEGNHPREKTYTSVSPEIPFMILRDPPGDGSYSYLEKGTTTETSLKFMTQQSGSVNAWVEAKAGVAFSAGEGVSFDFAAWGSIKGSLEVGASVSNGTEHNMTITNGQTFSTSESPDFIGEEGDLFAGAAMNIIYALTDIIEYDAENCSVNKYAKIIMGVDGFETEFIYTESHIANSLIPQLEQLRDIYLSEGSDSAKIYQNQISAWQQALTRNKNLKEKAEFIENRSFSSGGRVETFEEVIESSTVTYEFALYVEAGVAIEAGIEAAGSGVSGGVEAKFRAEFGDFESTTEIQSTKTGYVLDDDDEGDFFSVDISADGVYGTPVFKLVSGRSSCPWEENTQPREGVQLITDTFLETVDDPEGEAIFRLQLGNTSQSDDDRMYNLVFLQASNPDGAEISLGGSQVQGGVLTPYYIPAGGSKEATITVKRGPLAYHYNNLQFTLLSNCEDENIADTVSLSAHFASLCSEVSMQKPHDNWVINKARDNLPLRLEGYDISSMELIKLQYSEANSNDWITDFTIALEDIGEEKTELSWNFNHYTDGAYDLRAAVECADGSTYSDVITGIIDRIPPIIYGIPEPSDFVLDSGEFIVVNFDEELNCDKISSENVTITDVNSGTNFTVQVGCTGNSLMFVPELPTEFNIENDTFNVAVFGIEDLYGNSFEDTIVWAFLVPAADQLLIDEEADADGDSILNKDDNCPFSFNFNQYDLDNDGIGDKCDEDIDGDGVLNVVDNCMIDSNPFQEDINGDGIGDQCQDLTAIQPAKITEGFMLYENYPNPFSDFTSIKFKVPERSRVVVKIYNSSGSVIAILMDQVTNTGEHEIMWKSKDFSNGLYFYSMEALSEINKSRYIKTRKMILFR